MIRIIFPREQILCLKNSSKLNSSLANQEVR